MPWVCGGNFNEMYKLDEKVGGHDKQETTILNFRIMLSDYELGEMGYSGPSITWNDKQSGAANVQERLDRFVIFPSKLFFQQPR